MNDELSITVSRKFNGSETPGFTLTATWLNDEAGNDAIQAILGLNVGEAFKQMQAAKEAGTKNA